APERIPQLKVVKGTEANTIPDFVKKSEREIFPFPFSIPASLSTVLPDKTFRPNQTPPRRISSIIMIRAKTNLVENVIKRATKIIERISKRISREIVPNIPAYSNPAYPHHKNEKTLPFTHLIFVARRAV